MTVYDIVSKLDSAGIKVWVDDGQLKIKAPKGALTKELRAELVEYKAELLNFLPSVKSPGKKEEAMPVVPRDGDLALSYAQQRMWFLAQLEPGNAAYHIRTAIELTGSLDIHALQRAIKNLIDRHESLRTTFVETDGVPKQQINDEAPFVLPLEQLASDQVELYFSKFVAEAFDLSTGPLFKAKLIQQENDRYVLMIVMHHIISDGWSTAVMVNELSALYASNAMSIPSSLPPVSTQYVDYAYWQKAWLSGDREERQLAYWTQQLIDTPVLMLPADYSRPAVKSTEGSVVSFDIDASSVELVKIMAKQKNASLFMTLLSVFNCLMYRYTGQQDFSVGSPIANRTNAQLEGTVGLFVNTLAMRAQFAGSDTFLDHLGQVQSVSMDGFEHQDIPFERIVDALGVARDMSHTPIFQVMFVLQNTPGNSNVKLPGVEVHELKFVRNTSPMDITMTLVEELDGSVSGELEYCTDLFSNSTAKQMCTHYVSFLKSVLDNPEQLVAEVDYLTLTDKQCLLTEWGSQKQSYDQSQTLDGWFQSTASQFPNNIAITDGENSLTYAALNAKSNQLARYLLKTGVTKGSLVAISLERSANVPIAILSVLKAGATYVPVDPSNPADRIQFILEDAQVQVVITDAGSKEGIPLEGRTSILIDRTETWSECSVENLSDEPLAAHDSNVVAYVIYTSGTTGKPKGVQVPHGQVERLFHSTQQDFGFDDKDVWTLFHSYAFDFSVWEIWGALLYGGRLVIVPKVVARAPSAFYELLQSEGVTVLNQTPTAFTHLIKEDEALNLESSGVGKGERSSSNSKLKLRYVVFGGEALDFSALQTWTARYGDSSPKLINMYGITETTVHVSYYEVTESDLVGRRSLIGRPLDDLSLYILDSNLSPVPSGVAGEMYVGGAGITKGYLNQPELTDERFIPFPNTLVTAIDKIETKGVLSNSAKLYKTGDVARYLRDENKAGVIEYLGRSDDQVKIRGFRIELGEIESTLTTGENVNASVATIYKDKMGESHIVAYVDGENLNVADLKAHLLSHLPEYMVPTQVMVLEHLPLTANGKVDKKALPDPDFQSAAMDDLVGPSSDDEIGILSIWTEVLGLDVISVEANFFEIGGHSLLATQVISRIRKFFNIEISLKSVFESPTIRSLSLLVETARQAQSGVEAPPAIVALEESTEKVLSFAQHRLWFVDQLDQKISAYNLPVALRLSGTLAADDLESAFKIILSRHSVLCAQFKENDGEPVLEYKDPTSWCLERGEIAGPALTEFIENHAETLFDLANDWLFIAKLIACGEDRHVLLINMHHVVSDGWSMGVMINELKVLLEQTDTQKTIAQRAELLPALEIQYDDYAHWQRAWLQGDNLENLKQYWIEALDGAPSVLRVPTDFPRPEKPTFTGAHFPVDLGEETTKAVYAYCEANAVTPFMLLMSAYQVLLARYTLQDDICVGIPIANRNRYEIEGLIGFFVNGMIIRGQQKGNPSRRAFVDSIKDVALGAFAHQDMPMDLLVDALKMNGGGGHAPGAQVAFALQNMPDLEVLSMPGLDVEILEREHKTAKYELTLILEERDSRISGVMEFNTDLFRTETVALMASHFTVILEQMLMSPDKTISSIELVSGNDLRKVLGCDQKGVEVLPLSPIQRDVYIQIVSEPEALTNCIGSSCVFNTEVDLNQCRQAFEELVRQHPTIKSQLIASEQPYLDIAYLKVDSNRVIKLKEYDCSDRTWSQDEINELIQREVYQPYDLLSDELFKLCYFKLDGDRTLILIALCHLVADGTGMFNCTRDFFNLLNDVKDGNEFTDLNVNIHEYVLQSRQTFDTSKTIEFWKEQSNDIEVLQVSMPVKDSGPTKKPDTGSESNTRIEEFIDFDQEEFDSIKRYCSELGVHPATYFKALYVVMLHYYCRPQSNFYFTEILGGRSREYWHSFGCFFQALPTVIPIELMGDDASITEVISYFQANKTSRRGFDKLSRLALSKVMPSGEQEFMCNYFNFLSEVSWNGETVPIMPHPPVQNGPVQFITHEHADFFRLQFVYNSDLFESFNFLERFKSLSQQVVFGIEALAKLDFVLPQETSNLNVETNAEVAVDYQNFSNDSTLVDKVLNQCREFSTSVAVKYGNAAISYAELERQSRQWAGLFKDRGITAGERVVVCLDQGLALYPVLLGVLRVGAVYVPIDSGYPGERIRYILEDSKAHCIVTQDCVHERLTEAGVEIDANKLLVLEQQTAQLNQFSTFDSTPFHPTPESLMYVIYTSGSTGQPKGASVYHSGVVNLLDWYINELTLTSEDACLLVSSIGFDLTQKNPWAAFCSGAKLVIPAMDHYDPDEIAKSLKDDGITWINCAPSAFYPVIEDADLPGYPFKSLRHVVLGGETIRMGSLEKWLATDHGNVTLLNSYGPTECTDVVAAYAYKPGDGQQLSLPIGTAIPNVQIYVVNNRTQVVAPSFVGELCIAGRAVGGGYLDRADLTDKVFTDNPFGEGLLYRTGDLVRCSEHGQIEYVGRKDFQVKVRGLRIELGEIEFAMRQQEGVLDALVTVDEQQIIAYALSTEKEFDARDLQQKLGRSIPDFMVPSHIVILDQWPLTPNGKIDRKALPEPSSGGEQEFVAPSTDTEIRLALIWCDVLNVDKVGVHDNFFDLGGHSLLAARVISKLRKEFNIEVSLRVLFEMRTVNDIAQYIDRLNWAVQSLNPAQASGQDEGEIGADEPMDEGFL